MNPYLGVLKHTLFFSAGFQFLIRCGEGNLKYVRLINTLLVSQKPEDL